MQRTGDGAFSHAHGRVSSAVPGAFPLAQAIAEDSHKDPMHTSATAASLHALTVARS